MPGHRVNVFLAHAHVNDGGPSSPHRASARSRRPRHPLNQMSWLLPSRLVLYFIISFPHNPGYKYPGPPSKGDCKVGPSHHRVTLQAFLNSAIPLACPCAFVNARFMSPLCTYTVEHGGQGSGTPLIWRKSQVTSCPWPSALSYQPDGPVDWSFSPLAMPQDEAADSRRSCLPANQSFPSSLSTMLSPLAPYMGGSRPSAASSLTTGLQQPGKLIQGCTPVAFRKVHDAHGHACALPLLHGIHQGPGSSAISLSVNGVSANFGLLSFTALVPIMDLKTTGSPVCPVLSPI